MGPPRIQWSEDMRTTLMLLWRHTSLKDDKAKVTAIFNSIYAKWLVECGYPDGLSPERLHDAWRARLAKNRSAEWSKVDDSPKTERQRAHRQSLLKKIHQVAAEIYGDAYREEVGNVIAEDGSLQSGDDLAMKRASSSHETDSQATEVVETDNDETDEEEMPKEPPNNRLSTGAKYGTTNKERTREKYGSEDSTEAIPILKSKGTMGSKRRTTSKAKANGEYGSNTSATANGAIEGGVNDRLTTVVNSSESAASHVARPLEMIHAIHKEAATKSGTPLTNSAFMHHDDPVYELAGRVYTVKIEGSDIDVMVCNRNRCRRCNKKILDPSLLGKAASKTQGLPFIHANDKETVRGVGLKFIQQDREYNNKYPDDMSRSKVTFSDGVKREVMMCAWKKCELCSGKEAVEEYKAKHERMREMQKEMRKALPSIEGEDDGLG